MYFLFKLFKLNSKSHLLLPKNLNKNLLAVYLIYLITYTYTIKSL